MTSGGGEGRGATDGAVDGPTTGVGDGGRVEAVGSVPGVVAAGLSDPAEGLTWDTGLGPRAAGPRPHPLTTMTNPAMRAAEALASVTPS